MASLVRIGLVVLAGGLGTSCITRDVGFADRCADVMKQSWSGGAVAVTGEHFAPDPAKDLNTATADVQGVGTTGARRDDVAMQCDFHDGVLTEFHWTKPPP